MPEIPPTSDNTGQQDRITGSAASELPIDPMTLAGLQPSWIRGFACPDCGAKPYRDCADRLPDDLHNGRIRASFFGQVIPIRDAIPGGSDA